MPDIDEIYNGIAEALELYFKYTDGGAEPVEFRIKRQGAEVLLELLKRQKPVAPRKVKRYIAYSDTAVNFLNTYDCGNCGEELPDNAKYCPACGRSVKWDE